MNWLKGASIAVVSAGLALGISQMMRQPVEGQVPDVKLSRTADGKPDLNGIWQAMGTAHWDLLDHHARSGPVLELGAIAAVPAGLSVVEGNQIPYQPWAAAKKKENYENWLSRDPEVKCYLPGIPRATYMPYPFQILQTHNNDILMAYEYASASRVIKMGKTEPPPVDTWMGQSLEDSNASLPQTGSERAVDGVQVRRVRRGVDVRTLAQENGRRETVRRRAHAVAVACASRKSLSTS